MRTSTALAFALALASASLLQAPSAEAANANQPYQNVDKSNDKGNDTGDSKVETLNNAQSDRNYVGQNKADQGNNGQPTVSAPPVVQK